MKQDETIYSTSIDSPLGKIGLFSTESNLIQLSFLELKPTSTQPPILGDVQKQLVEYFEGKRDQFELSLSPKGSQFQMRVWDELLAIKKGQTTYYQKISNHLNCQNGSRAVGHAVGSNPIPIIIPCHRVLGKKGALVGYSGGIWRKVALLELEGATFQKPLF